MAENISTVESGQPNLFPEAGESLHYFFNGNVILWELVKWNNETGLKPIEIRYVSGTFEGETQGNLLVREFQNNSEMHFDREPTITELEAFGAKLAHEKTADCLVLAVMILDRLNDTADQASNAAQNLRQLIFTEKNA